MTFADKIKQLRLDKNLTQEQASKEMNIAISSLRNYENGRLPDTHQLKIIKNYYNVTYQYLLEDECQNKSDETVNIGNILKLSDKSIQIIKDLQHTSALSLSNNSHMIINDTISPKVFNFFIENFKKFDNFIDLLDILICLTKIFTDITYLSSIFRLKFYIIDSISKNKSELSNLFTSLDKSIFNIFNILDDNKNHIDMNKDSFYKLLEYIKKFKNYCNNPTLLTDLENDNCIYTDDDFFIILDDCQYICLDCESLIIKEIDYTKYQLNKIFADFFDNVQNRSSEYNSKINKDLLNCKKINSSLKKCICLKERKYYKKERDNNVSKRNNKK